MVRLPQHGAYLHQASVDFQHITLRILVVDSNAIPIRRHRGEERRMENRLHRLIIFQNHCFPGTTIDLVGETLARYSLLPRDNGDQGENDGDQFEGEKVIA